MRTSIALALLFLAGCRAGFTQEYILSTVPERVRTAPSNIVVNDTLSHYRHQDTIAHVEPDSRLICMKSSALREYPGTLWHELAHAYSNRLLRESSPLHRLWGTLGATYMTIYGTNRKSAEEDRAQTVEYVYLEAHGVRTPFYLVGYRFTSQHDHAALRVKLLYEYGFFSKEIYERFLKRMRE